MQFISRKYVNFKEKNRNKYYYYRSHVEVVVRYVLINIIKIIVLPIVLILYPLFKFFEYKKIFFVHDIMPGVGHLVPEFDLFRFQHKNKSKIILICSENQNYNLIVSSYKFYKIYKPKFFLAISIILDFYPKIIIKASQTLPNHVMPINIFTKKYEIKYHFKDYIKYLSYRKNLDSHFKEIFKKKASENEFLNNEKIACLHIRENISHAVPVVTNPITYLKSIEYLNDNNYKIYFIGRERMPDCFKKYDIINYAESDNASLENDFKLIYASEVSVICGSGASYIPDTLDKKYLYLNSYHISRPGGIGKLSITLPSIVSHKYSKKKLSFYDQLILENSGTHLKSSFLNLKKYDLLLANENQILISLIELEKLNPNIPLTKEQSYFNNNFKKFGWLSETKARISQSFLQENINNLFN